jgi:hypothetical protein
MQQSWRWRRQDESADLFGQRIEKVKTLKRKGIRRRSRVKRYLRTGLETTPDEEQRPPTAANLAAHQRSSTVVSPPARKKRSTEEVAEVVE